MPRHENEVNFDRPHENPSQSIPTQKKTLSIHTLKPSKLRTAQNNNVNFDPVHKNQVNFHPYYKIESISTPRHQNRVKIDPGTKNKSFLTPTQNPSQSSSLRWNEVNLHQSHKN